MKILESYKKMAKSMLTEHAWDRKFGEPLVTLEDVMKEAESMKLQPKGGGKTVVFKDKDNYEKAKSSGDYEDPEGSGDGGEKEEPSGKLGGGDFERDTDTTGGDPDDSWDDEEGRAKPSGGDFTKSADYDMWSDDDEKPSVDDSRQKAVQSGMALKNAEKEFGKDSSEYGDAKRADDEAQGEYQQAKASQEQRQKDINSGKVEPETKEEAEGAASAARDSVEKQKQNRDYALQQPDPRDPRSPAEQEAGWDKTVADAEKRAGEAEAKAREFGGGDEGGKEESISINGKKYKEVKEHAWDRKFGEPLPTLADVMKVKEEKKVTKKHILREMYEKIGGK